MFGVWKSIIIVRLCQIIDKSRAFLFPGKREVFVPKNILIINVQGVGDMVIFTPVVEALKRKFPTTSITMLTSSYGAAVLENNPFVTKIISEDNINTISLKSYSKLLKRIRAEKFDCVIDTSFTCLSIKQMLLPYISGAQQRIAYARGGFCHFLPSHQLLWKQEHVMEMYAQIANLFGAPITLTPKLFPRKEDNVWAKNYVRKMKRPLLIIHPSCQGKEKIWPAENFEKLIRKMQRKYSGTYIITAISKEKEAIEIIEKNLEKKMYVLMDASVLQIAALLEEANLLVSIDTGVVHIATATKTPTVCIYGRTGQLFWHPYNKNQIVVQNEPCAVTGNNPNPYQVIEYLDPCPIHGKDCIRAVTVEEVEKAVEIFFKKKRHKELKL